MPVMSHDLPYTDCVHYEKLLAATNIYVMYHFTNTLALTSFLRIRLWYRPILA